MNNYFYDDHQTRYQLVKSTPGKNFFNWLFIPGGPGVDSCYLLALVNTLSLEGNCWLIDLPPNKSSVSANDILKETWQNWDQYFITAINHFENPVLVGHSFGGFYPLFFPELKTILKGLIILNATPTVPTPDEPTGTALSFLDNPTDKTITDHFLSFVPFIFHKNYFEQGKKLIKSLKFDLDKSVWWLSEGAKKYRTIQWVPENIPVLLIGGSCDLLTPLELFKADDRFQRSNVELINIIDAGHFPWLEKPAEVKDAIRGFIKKLR